MLDGNAEPIPSTDASVQSPGVDDHRPVVVDVHSDVEEEILIQEGPLLQKEVRDDGCLRAKTSQPEVLKSGFLSDTESKSIPALGISYG